MSLVPRPSRQRWLVIALIFIAVTGALAWGGYQWVLGTAQVKINERLSARGLCLQYSGKTWSPWRGLTLKDAVLCRLADGHEPLIEISALHVDILWREVWRARAAITRWRADDATLTLHDQEGAVRLEHFTTDLAVRDDKVEVARLDMRGGPLEFAIAGQIITASVTDSPTTTTFSLNLKPLRAVMDALNFKPGTGPFTITGTFAIDLRGALVICNAKLRGAGRQVEWRGVPMQEAEVSTELSQADLKLDARLKFAHGSATVELTREGWEQNPLIMSGTLTDSAGRVDEFKGKHQGTTDTLTITSLSGAADLLELARNLPVLAAQIPTTVSVKTFPDVAVRDFVWQAGAQPPEWSLATLQVRTPADLVVTVQEQSLGIDKLTGRFSRERGSWKFDGVKGRLLGGQFAVDGSHDGKTLNLSGTLTDSAGRTDEFKASHEETTRTLTIASLSGSADLLECARQFPPLAAQLPATFSMKTFPDIAVRNFVWRAGGKSSDWSLADLHLRKPAEVIVRVRDQPLAIGRLTGRVAYEQRRWRFDGLKGQLLGGQFAVDATYDGHTLSKASIAIETLHLARLSPWVGKVSARLDDAELSLTYGGTLCDDPAHSTGSGTLELNHAPVVHIPLLDAAYQLFPKLLPREDRSGTGDIHAAFSITQGIATIDPLKARGESLTVTASGTVDLVKRRVAGHARANLRGLVGVATYPLSYVLTDMEISGPLDDIRVTPDTPASTAKTLITGTTKVVTGTIGGSARLSTNVLRQGLSLPFEALGMFGKDKPEPARN